MHPPARPQSPRAESCECKWFAKARAADFLRFFLYGWSTWIGGVVYRRTMSHALRKRFLVAMGLPMFACTKDKPTDTATVASVSATATETATATATASATASATATASVADPDAAVPNLTGRSGGGGCGFVVVCDDAPKTAPKDAAPKPYEKCAATIPTSMSGSDPHRDGIFDVDQTMDRRARRPNVCCYKAPRALCGGGRPLRSEDGFVVADPIARRDWMASLSLEATTPERERAERFLVDGAAEHASVASFARASLQLLALGAPPDLIADVHRAALDEIEHARICYALAHRRGGPLVGPGPLAIDRAPFDTTLASFVNDTFLDGCVAETIAAIDARERAMDGDAIERRALAQIADDEERHAELAWRMLAWAVRHDPTGKMALRAAMADLCKTDPVVREIVIPCAEALLK